MEGIIWLLIWSLMLTVAALSAERCKLDVCLVCTDKVADCTTSSPDEVIPTQLSRNLINLTINYQPADCRPVVLKRGLMSRFSSLVHVHIFGCFGSVEKDTFDLMSNLKFLEISDTRIASLPDDLLQFNKKFVMISLQRNWFTNLPVNIFTRPSALERFDLIENHASFNLHCSENTPYLPYQFKNWAKLEQIRLVGFRLDDKSCSKNVSESFFKPLSHVKHLNVTGSEFFYGDQTLLKVFTSIQSISMGDVQPYKNCPAKASTLFQNLPSVVEYLDFSRWQNNQPANLSCIVTEEMTASLRKLPSLKYLSFNCSDFVFGPRLKQSLFSNMTQLKTINLNYCRISMIDNNALGGSSRLRNIMLSGNPLESRPFEIYESNSGRCLQVLTVDNIGIRSDDSLHYIGNFSIFRTLDISQNLIRYIPMFSKTFGSSNYACLRTIKADDCWIEAVFLEGEETASKVCNQFPNIRMLSFSRNRVQSLAGLDCFNRSLRILNLDSNLLQLNRDDNLRVITQLYSLTSLDISSNGLQILADDIFHKMTNLEHLFLSDNQLSTLPANVFQMNTRLATLSLSSNKLRSLQSSMFSHLDKLTKLFLTENEISTIDMSFLSFVDGLAPLHTFDIAENPFDCGCSQKYFQTWLRATTKVPNAQSLKCASPVPLINNNVLNYSTDFFICQVKLPLIISGSCLAAFLLTLCIAIPCYKYRWYVSHARVVCKAFSNQMQSIQHEENCSHDAYLSYNSDNEADCEWVVNRLVPAIEGSETGASSDTKTFSLYIPDRDSEAGSQRFTERCEALEKCRKIIIVISNSYLKSTHCLSEADLAGNNRNGTKDYQPDRILILIREELSEEIVRPPMTSLLIGNVLHVEGNDGSKEQTAFKRIKQYLSQRSYSYRKKQTSRITIDGQTYERLA